MTKPNLALAAATATAALVLAAGSAGAQTAYGTTQSQPTTRDTLGAIAGALLGDRLGLSQLDQGWLRGTRPLGEGQATFSTRVDTSQRSGSISASAAARLKTDYQALVTLETQYSAGGFSTQERADLNSRYNALIQTLDSGASGYGETAAVAEGRAAFDARVDASVNARRLTRTQATQLKADYQSVVQIETNYLADGALSTSERADLDARLDALDVRVGDGPTGTTPTTPTAPLDNRTRLNALDGAVTTAERSGAVSRADAADIRVELGDLDRLEAAYRRLTATSDDTAYLTRRIGELEARVRR